MKKTKTYLRITSVLFVSAVLLLPFAAAAQTPQVTYSSADFGDVLVDDWGVVKKSLVVSITYNGTGMLSFNYSMATNSCGFTALGSRTVLTSAMPSTEITVNWTPLKPGACTADLQILDILTTVAQITVKGNAIEEKPNTGRLLSSFDGWVASGELVGAGPGKSAHNRLNAFRNMLVEADTAMEHGRTAEAYGQLSAARKKIGEFVQDGATVSAGTRAMSIATTSATSALDQMMNLILEGLR